MKCLVCLNFKLGKVYHVPAASNDIVHIMTGGKHENQITDVYIQNGFSWRRQEHGNRIVACLQKHSVCCCATTRMVTQVYF